MHWQHTWSQALTRAKRKRNLKFLSRVSRGEREIKSSYFFRVEIEISKKDVLLTCKWLFFIQTHFYYRTHVYLKMNENFNITLGNREKKEKNFFPLSKIERNKNIHFSKSRKSRIEREMKIFIFRDFYSRFFSRDRDSRQCLSFRFSFCFSDP